MQRLSMIAALTALLVAPATPAWSKTGRHGPQRVRAPKVKNKSLARTLVALQRHMQKSRGKLLYERYSSAVEKQKDAAIGEMWRLVDKLVKHQVHNENGRTTAEKPKVQKAHADLVAFRKRFGPTGDKGEHNHRMYEPILGGGDKRPLSFLLQDYFAAAGMKAKKAKKKK